MEKLSTDELAKILWDYHLLHNQLGKADLIWVLGSHDLRVAEYAADLMLEDYAPLILFSGGIAHSNDLLKTSWNLSEAEKFAEIAIKKGVSKKQILLEDKSKNTGENITFGFKVIEECELSLNKIIVVQKPYMERRTLATFKKQWPGNEVEIVITSPPISFDDYPNEEVSKDEMINIMVGDLQRIKVYAEKGWQIQQEIPPVVWEAFERLVKKGFDKHLVEKI